MNFNRLLIIVFLISFSKNVSAQSNGNAFRFGLKTALNFGWTNANSKNISNDGLAMGFSYGIMGDFNFQKNYALSTEIIFTHIHNRFSFDSPMAQSKDLDKNQMIDTFSSVSVKYKNQYLQVPLSMKFRTKEIGYITYWGQFGVAPGFLINSKTDWEGVQPTDDYLNLSTNDNESDAYHLIDVESGEVFNDRSAFFRFPVIIGAGIEYGLAGNASLYTGFRVENSFSDLLLKDKKTKANVNVLSLNVGVFF